jgi:hypothetical protein
VPLGDAFSMDPRLKSCSYFVDILPKAREIARGRGKRKVGGSEKEWRKPAKVGKEGVVVIGQRCVNSGFANHEAH